MSAPIIAGKRLMTREQYAAKRGFTTNTEANHRRAGISPPYLSVPAGRFARIFYDEAEVEAWLLEHTVR